MVRASVKRKKAAQRKAEGQQLEEVVAQQQHEQQQGTLVECLPDAELFFEDKAGSEPAAGGRKRRRSRAEQQARLLTCQVVAQRPAGSKPVAPQQAPRRHMAALLRKQQQKLHAKDVAHAQPGAAGPGAYDVWADAEVPAVGTPERRPAKRRRPAAPHQIAAVEVAVPGCSYNPDAEQHQDALAAAVAAEVRRQGQADVQRPAPAGVLEWRAELDPLEELLDAGAGYSSEEDAAAAEEAQPSGAAMGGAAGSAKRTAADRNRALRRVAAEREAEAKRRLRKQRRDLHNLAGLQQQVTQEQQQRELLRHHRAEAQVQHDHRDAARELLRERKAASKVERALQQPPRLGRLKFAPGTSEVLLTDELQGSLRKLKASPLLLEERYKSLQKRGIIEPRKPATKRKGRRVNKVGS